MKAEEILNIWGAPDNSRLTAKQLSVRLPVHVAARVNALCDMYPNKTRTEIIGDLLSMALKEIEAAFPSYKGDPKGETPDGDTYFEERGPYARYVKITNEHYKKLEEELGNNSAQDLLGVPVHIGDKE